MQTALAVGVWLTTALGVLPVLYVVLRTHRERSTEWWAAMSVCGTPGVPTLLFLMWLLYTGSGGLAQPLLLWTAPDAAEDDGADLLRALAVLPPLAAAVLYVLWPLVLLVSHATGYALLLAVLQAALSAGALGVLLAARATTPALFYVPHVVWSVYVFGASVGAWRRRNQLLPTVTRYASKGAAAGGGDIDYYYYRSSGGGGGGGGGRSISSIV